LTTGNGLLWALSLFAIYEEVRVYRSKKLLGDELQLIQFGGMPKDAKPCKGIGSGVLELALRYASDAYRVVLAVPIGNRIYVLHAFQKKSKKGIETPKRDVDQEAIHRSTGVGT
jgi:phage-related protein